MTGATYEDIEYVLAEIITEATGEPRVGRFERTLAKSALARLREVGLALSTPPADDVREARDLDALEARARAHSSAIDVMHEIGRGVGALPAEHFTAFRAWQNDSDRDHADTVLELIERLRAAEVRPHGTVTDADEVDALIADTRAFLAERPIGPPIIRRIGKLVAALQAAREGRSDV